MVSRAKGPLLYAHRGAAAEAPENTLEAFRVALSCGADAIETDAHLTADGHVVLSHDPTGRRVAGVAARIEDTTLAEVQRWDAGACFVAPGRGRPFAGHGMRIPTLEEALTAFPEVIFNVDAKSEHPDMPAKVVEVVRRARAEERTRLASFQARTLRAIRALGYRGETGLAQAEVARLLLSPRALLRRWPLGGSAAQLPHRMRGVDLGARAVIAKCHELGLVVHYWTVNHPARAEELLHRGADAIMTDDPRALASTFAAFRARGAS